MRYRYSDLSVRDSACLKSVQNVPKQLLMRWYRRYSDFFAHMCACLESARKYQGNSQWDKVGGTWTCLPISAHSQKVLRWFPDNSQWVEIWGTHSCPYVITRAQKVPKKCPDISQSDEIGCSLRCPHTPARARKVLRWSNRPFPHVSACSTQEELRKCPYSGQGDEIGGYSDLPTCVHTCPECDRKVARYQSFRWLFRLVCTWPCMPKECPNVPRQLSMRWDWRYSNFFRACLRVFGKYHKTAKTIVGWDRNTRNYPTVSARHQKVPGQWSVSWDMEYSDLSGRIRTCPESEQKVTRLQSVRWGKGTQTWLHVTARADKVSIKCPDNSHWDEIGGTQNFPHLSLRFQKVHKKCLDNS